jgi:hypothetical protein
MSAIEKTISGAILKRIRARRAAATAGAVDSLTRDTAATAPAKLREARFSDFEAVADLKQKWGLNAESIENWERLWQRNPALVQSVLVPSNPERPIGWVLEADGAVVGYLGNISLAYRYGDKTLSAATAHGLVVDPAYRALGLTLVAAYFRQKSVDLFISTSAIENVGKIALAFKSSPVPQRDYDTVLFWVLRPYGFGRALVKKLNFGPVLAQASSALIAFAVAVDKIVRRRWPRQSSSPFSVNEIRLDEIDSDFQTLWIAKQKEGSRLLADRSPAALRWHFEIPGDRGSSRVLCCYKNSELLGYAIVRSDTKPENDLRVSLIADLVAKRDDPEVLRALWVAAFDVARQAGSHVLEVMGFPCAIRQLSAKWNPYRRKYPACPFYFKAANPALHETLSDEAVWYASPFDGDATLVRPSYPISATSTHPRVARKDTAAKRRPESLEHVHPEVV